MHLAKQCKKQKTKKWHTWTAKLLITVNELNNIKTAQLTIK